MQIIFNLINSRQSKAKSDEVNNEKAYRTPGICLPSYGCIGFRLIDQVKLSCHLKDNNNPGNLIRSQLRPCLRNFFDHFYPHILKVVL